jgi:hypothetical protein
VAKTSRIVLWDTAPRSYDSNGGQILLLGFEALTTYSVQRMEDSRRILRQKVLLPIG